ncbi:hypothetical protein BJ875DRAFT_257824 [Amylocarpus encephaloides]|uniref:CFEM domain-containing protein n=1 Tax=Amylocarpus encephaloides TaxID=45428 RepID=A0A9P7Y7Z9_9HELO|nr:hypothetical protein BJ875DRAFT_257824 [Amylocarpus encephaloides]
MGALRPSLALRFLLFSIPLSVVSQSSINDFPSCSTTCYNDAITLSGCGKNDLVCQCGDATQTTTVQAQLTICLTTECTQSDILLYNSVAYAICAQVAASNILSSTFASVTTPVTVPESSTATGGRTTTVAPQTTGASSELFAPTVTVTASSTGGKKKSNLGAIIGGVVGGLVVLSALVLGCIFCIWKRSKSKRAKKVQASSLPQPSHSQPPPQYVPPTPQTQIQYPPPVMKQEGSLQPGFYAPVKHQGSPTPSPVPSYVIPTPNSHTVELHGSERASFVEIGGTQTISGQPTQPAELGGNPNIPR